MALYAAYGSNMDPEQMLLRCPHSEQPWSRVFVTMDIRNPNTQVKALHRCVAACLLATAPTSI